MKSEILCLLVMPAHPNSETLGVGSTLALHHHNPGNGG